MFGIGLPELIIILALALIVVGPEKLPELARSIAKGMMELKKTANALRDSIQEEMDDVKKEVKPWEQLPQDRPPWGKTPTELSGAGSPLQEEASLEEHKETALLPEEAQEQEGPEQKTEQKDENRAGEPS